MPASGDLKSGGARVDKRLERAMRKAIALLEKTTIGMQWLEESPINSGGIND